ncbi:MFS transporter [Pseudonocardia bannensis]
MIDARTVRRAVGAAAMGNPVEWFDYGVYSFVAVIIARQFFPGGEDGSGLLATFAIFAVAYLVRPLGGLVLGPLVDRIGRRRVLALTIVMMSAATFAIGLLPTYAQVGVLAPILLLTARLVQGFATGGEYGGAAAFIAEYAPDRRRGFYCSFLETGTLGGFVLAAGLVTTLQLTLPPQDMESWGWRVPFLVAGPLGLIGLRLRSKLEDTPAFRMLQQEQDVPDAPMRELLTRVGARS